MNKKVKLLLFGRALLNVSVLLAVAKCLVIHVLETNEIRPDLRSCGIRLLGYAGETRAWFTVMLARLHAVVRKVILVHISSHPLWPTWVGEPVGGQLRNTGAHKKVATTVAMDGSNW